MRILSLFGSLTLTLSLAGCGDGDPATPATTSTGIEIEGTWTGEFGDETIADDSWTTGFGTAAITDYSNTDNVAITLSPDDASFNPGTYNRIVWTDLAGGSFYYCTTDFGLATEADAQAASTVPDASDPATSGCGGSFPWTKLSKP
jgi:hypothetical protein